MLWPDDDLVLELRLFLIICFRMSSCDEFFVVDAVFNVCMCPLGWRSGRADDLLATSVMMEQRVQVMRMISWFEVRWRSLSSSVWYSVDSAVV